MKTIGALCLCVLLASVAHAQSPTCDVAVAWDAPEPGDAPIASYRLDYGTAPLGSPGNSGYSKTQSVPADKVTMRVVLTAGTWYASVRATDTRGATSLYSNEISIVCQPIPPTLEIPNAVTGITGRVIRG